MKMSLKMLVPLLSLFAALTVSSGEEGGDQSFTPIPYFPGMPNYEITNSDDKEFDAHKFFNGKTWVNVEGKLWYREYSLKEGARSAGELQLLLNYSKAVKGMKGTVFIEGACEGEECGDWNGVSFLSGKVSRGDKEVWVEMSPHDGGAWYTILVVEKEAMKQEVTARDMWNALEKEGHIAVYIDFDPGMAIIKPESEHIIDQIAILMKQNPDLKLGIEGHTDNVGDRKKNKFLSEERARSVVAALVNMGIDPKRLAIAGFGQDKPIADNKTEEGRAKNRRIELVKK